jgi:hypothetical protein
MSRRRQLVFAAGLGPLVTPFAAQSQPALRPRRIGVLSLSETVNEALQPGRSMFYESVRRAGWEEGRNVAFDVARFAIQHKILSFSGWGPFTSVGGAASYTPSFQELMDRTVSYVDRILRGAKPGDLPVEQPTKFDLIINLKTMRALGISVPQSVLRRADEVIE